MLQAPWITELVEMLNARQIDPRMHPYTCGSGNRCDAAHAEYQRKQGRDYGQLVATTEGWICPVCGYVQDWAI